MISFSLHVVLVDEILEQVIKFICNKIESVKKVDMFLQSTSTTG